MILELLFGLIASVAIMLFFRVARYSESADTWIISMSKFVYFSGHPLLNDDQKFEQVTQIHRSIILSLLRVILKTFLIILFALGTIAVVSTLCGFVRERALPDPHSPYFLRLLFPDYLLDWPFIAGTLLPFVLVPLLSKKDYKEEYSSMDKFVHYLFLGNKLMAKLQFRLECLLNTKTIRTTTPFQHVYISGLARSGSTSLMQYLGQLPEFVSLSYLNMPFIFMPRTGPKLISKRKKMTKERSHKDGMTHSLRTYEAFEEPFWLHFVGPDYVEEDCLTHHRITVNVHHEYQKFRTLVAGDMTYLAKNNNHLLRAESIYKLDAQKGLYTRTIIPFREPYAQATSLLRQHGILSNLQSENDFALDYMDLLVHHEFGLHAKYYLLTGKTSTKPPEGDLDSIDHWLEVWYRFYRDALELYAGVPDFCFFCYEKYCKNPRRSLLSLCSFIQVTPQQIESLEFKDWKQSCFEGTRKPDKKLSALYDRLTQEAINREV